MIDVHETTKVIQEMLPVMDPEADYMTIVAAEGKITSSEAARKKELEEAHAKLKAFTRTLEAARVSSTRPASVPSQEANAATLNELDSTKLSMAKAISDSEALLTNKEAELAALKEEARRLELYDPAVEHGKELDGTALRLAFYRGLGFMPVVNKDGDVSKMLVQSESGDLHTIDFNTNMNDFEYTQLLWKIASS